MKELVIAGLGIKDLKQMTLEAYKEILSAEEVLYLGCEPREHIPEISSWNVKSVRSILELYVDGDVDDNNYTRLQREVSKAAQRNYKTVLLVPGHPLIGVTLVQRLLKHPYEFKVRVLPGISSFDTMINDLQRDPLEKGSLIVDANRMLMFQTVWPSHLDCYLYHVCSVGTRIVHVKDAQRDNAWDLLKRHLLKIYSPTTTVSLVSSSTKESKQAQKVSANLEDIETLKSHVHFGTTLFIEAEKPKRIDRDFLMRLRTGSKNEIAV